MTPTQMHCRQQSICTVYAQSVISAKKVLLNPKCALQELSAKPTLQDQQTLALIVSKDITAMVVLQSLNVLPEPSAQQRVPLKHQSVLPVSGLLEGTQLLSNASLAHSWRLVALKAFVLLLHKVFINPYSEQMQRFPVSLATTAASSQLTLILI